VRGLCFYTFFVTPQTSSGARGEDCLAVNMSGQHVCMLRFESRSSRRVGILASDMAYGVVRQGFDPGLQVFLCQQKGVHTSCGSDPFLFTRLDMHVRNPLLLPNG
jgi:hypothetical protein